MDNILALTETEFFKKLKKGLHTEDLHLELRDFMIHIHEVTLPAKAGILIADVTAFEETGRSLIAWTKHHIQIPGFKTHGYSATETPSVIRHIYYCGPDQRFFFSHTDIDHLTGLLYGLFTDHPELKWIQELVSRVFRIYRF